jgi:hypothetical protein
MTYVDRRALLLISLIRQMKLQTETVPCDRFPTSTVFANAVCIMQKD